MLRRSLRLVLATVGCAILATTIGCGSGSGDSSDGDKPTVAIANLANVPALTDIVDGVTNELKAKGYDDTKVRIDSQNANGDVGVIQTIATKFAADKPAAIVTITTPALQAAVNATKPSNEIPVLFGGVSDPVAAGAVKSLDGPTGTNVAGVYNVNPVPQVLDLTKEIVPDVRSIGIMYNPGEDNSVADAEFVEQEAAKRGLELVKATVSNSNEVQSAAQSIVDKVDVVVMLQDTTVATAGAALFKVARDAHKPVLAIDAQLVEDGAVAGLGRDNRETGAQVADMVIQVLEGKNVGDIPLEPVKPASVVVNASAAEATGIEIPQSVLDGAKVVNDK